jgi:hypothetical protein
MGLYTNASFAGVSSDYTSVAPFDLSKEYNFHELGIIAAAESAMNTNAFMKQIGLQELAAVEQTGSDQVFYESVNLKGIFESVKKFFQKLIEKIHKIFHTFIAKLSSWFSSGKDFAKKYEKEIIKNWSKVSNDFEFKGYTYSSFDSTNLNLGMSNADAKTAGGELVKGYDKVSAFLSSPSKDTLTAMYSSGQGADTSAVSTFREKMDDWKDQTRAKIAGGTGAMDQKEFTEALFKLFRDGKDSKEDMNKHAIEQAYDGSISGLITYIKDYDKIKKNTEDAEKAFVKTVDELIKKMNTVEDQILKDTDADREKIVQASSLYQSVWGFIKEAQLQKFSAMLTAIKDDCSQAKEIAVMVIGLSKKMTANESTDMTDSYTGSSFLESVQLR